VLKHLSHTALFDKILVGKRAKIRCLSETMIRKGGLHVIHFNSL